MPETAAGLASAPPTAPPNIAGASVPPAPRNNIKETVISLVIAFALAFVFRGFVVEAFLIPTGSMAPTLNGAHMRFSNSRTGKDWAVGPRDMLTNTPRPLQGTDDYKVQIVDPMTRRQIGSASGVRTRAGDRIFVMKYLYSIFDPERFDVVVFKNPTEPQVNFIKRLIGLPGDQLALIDGDVWVRKPTPNDPINANAWLLPGWKVASKPELAQRTMWQPVFDSQFAPLGTVDGRLFEGPWRVPAEGNGLWKVAGEQDYRFEGLGTSATHLFWDPTVPIRDYYAYNEGNNNYNGKFSVGDLCLSMGIKPDTDAMSLSLVAQARRHEFKAEFSGSTVSLKMRPAPAGPAIAGGSSSDPAWNTLSIVTLKAPLKAGVVTDVEFWHVDQTLQVFVDGKRLAIAEYEWSPNDRILNSMNMGEDWAAELERNPAALWAPNKYQSSGARLEFSGGSFTISRVALKRDTHYQPTPYNDYKEVNGIRLPHSKGGQPALATAPSSVLTLGPDEFFCCGDNSPASLDGRLWDSPDPWVQVIDPKIGIVPRDLLIGKAFFVYFPAPSWRGMVPIPDFGRMRFIW